MAQIIDNFTRLAEIAFWISAGLLFYVYAGYPILLSGLGLLFRRKQPSPGYTPFVSVLIAAYNEEAGIGRKLEQTLALGYPADKLEILVLSDCSTDGTDKIVQACDDPRVRLLRMPQRKGKTHAQNEGAREAKGEVLVFSDATTTYHPQ